MLFLPRTIRDGCYSIACLMDGNVALVTKDDFIVVINIRIFAYRTWLVLRSTFSLMSDFRWMKWDNMDWIVPWKALYLIEYLITIYVACNVFDGIKIQKKVLHNDTSVWREWSQDYYYNWCLREKKWIVWYRSNVSYYRNNSWGHCSYSDQNLSPMQRNGAFIFRT